MGSNATKTIINCGTTQVSASVFSADAGTLVLEKLVVENLVYNYTEKDEWPVAATNALRNIFSTMKPKGEIVVIAPGQLLLTRNVRVPQVEESKRDGVIAFEAANNFPFPLEELVWGSQVIASDGVEESVVIFALKKTEIVRFTNLLIKEAKLVPDTIQPATNLDVQAYRYATLGESGEDPVLIVNVGAHTTNLTFVTPNGFDINNIGLGGNYVTQKLAEATGIPFQAAEQKKIAYFTESARFAHDDPVPATILAAGDSFVRRLSQDITRRLIAFKRANGGVGPKKIFISGRGSLLPGMAKKLSDLQRVDVEVLDATPLVRCAPGVDSDMVYNERFELQEVIGEASSLVMPDVKSVNLLPPEIAKELDFKKKMPFLALAGLFLAVAPWPVWMHYSEVGTALDTVRKSQVENIKKLEEREGVLKDLDEQCKKFRLYAEEFASVLDRRFRWNDFMADGQACLGRLQTRTAKDEDGETIFSSDRHIWLDSLSVRRSLKPAAEDLPAKIVCDVEIKFAMLIPEVDADTPEHNAGVFEARRKLILESLKSAEFVDQNEKITDKPDFSKPNLPTLTVTLRLKSDKGL